MKGPFTSVESLLETPNGVAVLNELLLLQRDEIEDLQKEVSHWKETALDLADADTKLRAEIEELKNV